MGDSDISLISQKLSCCLSNSSMSLSPIQVKYRPSLLVVRRTKEAQPKFLLIQYTSAWQKQLLQGILLFSSVEGSVQFIKTFTSKKKETWEQRTLDGLNWRFQYNSFSSSVLSLHKRMVQALLDIDLCYKILIHNPSLLLVFYLIHSYLSGSVFLRSKHGTQTQNKT